jgi:hypothetical protein
MSIRLRLTLLYGALVAMTVLASGTLLSLAIDQAIIDDITRAVTGEAGHLVLRPSHGPPRLALPMLRRCVRSRPCASSASGSSSSTTTARRRRWTRCRM